MDTEFAYWIPNMAGGFLTTEYPHEDQWDWEYNKKVIGLAEEAGLKYALSPARYFSSHSADHSLEAITTAAGLAEATEKIHLISAIHTGLWHPGPVANAVVTGDHISGGRFHINVVTGWFKKEYTGFGEPWLEHDERYARSEEFISVLKGLWESGRNGEPFEYNGRFYQISDALAKPAPKGQPLVFQAGNSVAARKTAARVADVFFLNGNYLKDAKEITDSVKKYAREFGTEPPRFAINSFLLQEDTEQEAKKILEQIIDQAPEETLKAFKEQVKQAGQASPEGEGMWDDAELRDLVQWNNGFRTGLIGTKEQIVERIRQLDAIGIDIVLFSSLNYTENLPRFGEELLPLVREAEPIRDPARVTA
ncbi:MAG: dimethyl sulfone monooxygenase SfnG [Balneolaceae bacterium]|nr:dimethyl sulfone monooxygenase SfnG [Balneolaceae bacterium]